MDDFRIKLIKAQKGDSEAVEAIFNMYRPLIIKNSMNKKVFDEDLYQELTLTLLKCVKKFRV